MIDDTKVDPSVLSPRAGVAHLTLQLRSTLQEATKAEEELAALDVDASLGQLRSRLGPLLDERRQALADELRREQEAAAASVAAAEVEAGELVAAATARAETARAEQLARAEAARAEAVRAEAERAEQAARAEAARVAAAALAARAAPVAAPAVDAPVVDPSAVDPSEVDEAPVELFDDPLLDWQADEPSIPPPPPPPVLELPQIVPAIIDEPHTPVVEPNSPPDAGWAFVPPSPVDTLRLPVEGLLVDPQEPGPPVADELMWAEPTEQPRQALHVVLDAESFAKAFAAAMAPVIEAQAKAAPAPIQYVAPTPQKKSSFWSHAWHPDVLLSGLAMVIVIIVLVAWTG